VFNALRQTGALDDAEAFAAQRAQIRLQADFEIRALQDENARRSQARFAGKEAVRLTIENNAAIAANLQQITRLRGDAAAAERAIDIEQEARTRRRIANLQAERLSLEQSFEAVRRTHELELSLFGRGDAERARSQARAQIEEKFRADLERLQNEIETKRTAGTATADDEREFEQRRALLRQFLQSSLSEWDAYYERRKEMERDASLGAAEAFARYREEAGNTAKLSEGFFTRGLQRVEDALVEFVTTGKLNWKGLADFIVAEITRIIIKQQIANALASFQGSGNSGAGSAFGTFIQGLFGGARAQGGPVEAGRIYRVNENAGPGEILNVGSRQYLLANQAGRVEPQQSTRQTVNNNSFNIAVPSNTTRETANQLASRAAMQLARASARDN
jgi:lambda family phage tail tape measure protein